MSGAPHRHRTSTILAVAAVVTGVLATATACASSTADLPDGLYADISTVKGDIIVQLEPDRAPLTTMNFVGLAEGTIASNRSGRPFYDGLTFHRVEPGFVVQGGDPAGNGTGGPGYQFPTEVHPDLHHDSEGVVAMANSGPDTNGSQFYITLGPAPHLDGGYSIFGRVVRGMDVVRALAVGDVMRSIRIVRVGSVAESYRATDERFGQLVDRVRQKRSADAAARRQEDERTIRTTWPTAVAVGDDGLLMVETTRGNGPVPVTGDAVSVHFTLELVDGTQVDDTRTRGVPYSFTLGEERIIPGLEEAIGAMHEGGSSTAIVPPELAFGAAGVPPVIPPNAFVVFRIELVSVN